jgi:3-hydroxyacyl-CoA dehydrogenase/enoyl-CoA hydratase/3-hydroxybutyryl-CoA epimerase
MLMNATEGASHWRLSTDAAGIAVLVFDKLDTSVNALSQATMQELEAKLGALERAPPKGLVITSGKSSGFIAGADVKEFDTIETPEQAYPVIRAGQQIFDRLERLPFPTVAAINGFALGGGLELALACRYRIVASDTKVAMGFPEVQLGIHPGFGGTVRAVQRLGPIHAMDLILSGRSVKAEQALRMGLVDRATPLGDLIVQAKRLITECPAQKQPSFAARVLNISVLRPLLAAQLRKRVARRARREHYPAPYSAIELWQKYGGHGTKAYEAEARSMAQLLCTQTSRNLVRVFLLQDRLKALGSEDFKAQAVHVVGAGVMGGDIASWCAARGLSVSLQDRSFDQVNPALARAREFFSARFKESSEREAATARLVADVEGERIRSADVVIEAIFEDPQAKRALYARLKPQLKPRAVLATNTSSIVLEELSSELSDPGRLVGLHFFNPVSRMPLVEIVHSKVTHADTVGAALAFARQLDKLPLPCRSSPGFVVNRILMPYLNEAIMAAEQGIPLSAIDRAATDFGMPMGPIELVDTVGLDVALHVGKILAAAFSKPAPASLGKLVEEKKLGKKNGRGFYVWENGKPIKPDSAPPPADLQDRLILAMVNEAVAVLREGVVDDDGLIDAGAVFGTGFAPFRGGPLRYARERGVDACVRRLEELSRKYGPHLTPDAGWHDLH